jgi:uncharacterized membrane protein (DUF485 family)
LDVSSRYGYVGKGLEEGALPLFLFSFTMKNTIIMLAVIGTFIATACFIGFVGYLLSDASYKECITDGALGVFMFLFGWVPSAVVAIDLNNKKFER